MFSNRLGTGQRSRSRRHRGPCAIVLVAAIAMFGLSGCIIPVPADVESQSGPPAVSEPLAPGEAVVVLGTGDLAECVREEVADRLPDGATVSPDVYRRLADSGTDGALQRASADSDNATDGASDAGPDGSKLTRIRFAITVYGSNSAIDNAYWGLGGTFTEKAHVRAVIEDLRTGTKLEPVAVTTSGDGIVHLVPYAIIGAIEPVTEGPACDAATDLILAAIAPDEDGSVQSGPSADRVEAIPDDPDADKDGDRDGR